MAIYTVNLTRPGEDIRDIDTGARRPSGRLQYVTIVDPAHGRDRVAACDEQGDPCEQHSPTGRHAHTLWVSPVTSKEWSGGRREIPPHIGKHIVLRDTFAIEVLKPEVVLGTRISLIGC